MKCRIETINLKALQVISMLNLTLKQVKMQFSVLLPEYLTFFPELLGRNKNIQSFDNLGVE